MRHTGSIALWKVGYKYTTSSLPSSAGLSSYTNVYRDGAALIQAPDMCYEAVRELARQIQSIFGLILNYLIWTEIAEFKLDYLL